VRQGVSGQFPEGIKRKPESHGSDTHRRRVDCVLGPAQLCPEVGLVIRSGRGLWVVLG
jgi:hypothetical protein